MLPSSNLILNGRTVDEFLQESTEAICLLPLMLFNISREIDDQTRFQKPPTNISKEMNRRLDKDFYRSKEELESY